jgi:hypothetical protein
MLARGGGVTAVTADSVSFDDPPQLHAPPLYTCPHTCPGTTICVLILLWVPHHMRSPLYTPPYTAVFLSSYYCICVLILLYLCPQTPHTTTYVGPRTTIYVQLYMCPHTTTYRPKLGFAVRALRRARTPTDRAHYICVLMLPYVSSYYYMCPHTDFSLDSLCALSDEHVHQLIAPIQARGVRALVSTALADAKLALSV